MLWDKSSLKKTERFYLFLGSQIPWKTSDFSETMMSRETASPAHEEAMWREVPDRPPAVPDIRDKAQTCK